MDVKLARGYLASMAGLGGVSLLIAFFSESFTSTNPFIDSPTIFHFLIVAPSEELVFRFFIPVLIMYLTGLSYLGAGFFSSIAFAMAHWWAYQQNPTMLIAAFAAGLVQTFVVYFFGQGEETFNFDPGLLCAIAGHATYNLVVVMAPGYLIYATLAAALGFAALSMLHVREL